MEVDWEKVPHKIREKLWDNEIQNGMVEEVDCAGDCGRSGYPNYFFGHCQEGEFYCGGSPRCCP
ncbi:hypothetical protein X832_gp144 [Pseudomonas phage PAK_P5]|uniref:Uncharacterized protein n=1 Tax=Pseudomonas phage PAK_P5 TaxID=1327964 RepID=V5JXH0_9CAUD|nr:hypothetical protein X832_gp144 [Pseudomonas phage PAK_P5]AGR89614.1 hypothetical protein PAK_P500147c [Pseudomonas phage PAK_P5]